MTRINTNVGSLVGRNNLAQANNSLSQSLTRLSTGLRINTGADDPAGLIASENLRSDITSIERAIGNTERAEQVIATADSALGQVSSLLNDIRGLVTESANSGALSEEQIEANQLQVDSSLEALNRIAQTTTFQGRRLLDGSLDFTTNAGANFSQLSDLQIDQANLGAAGEVSLDVNVTAAATQASLSIGDIQTGVAAQAAAGSLTFTSGTSATADVEFALAGDPAQAGTGSADFSIQTSPATPATATAVLETQATGTLTIPTEARTSLQFSTLAGGTIQIAGETIDITAEAGGNAAGAAGNDPELVINFGETSASTSFAAGVLTVNLTQDAGDATIDNVIAAINGGTDFDAALATGSTGTTTFTPAQGDAAAIDIGSGLQTLDITALDGGALAGSVGDTVVDVNVIFSTDQAEGTALAGTTLNITINSGTAGTTDAADLTLADLVRAAGAGSDVAIDTTGVNQAASLGLTGTAASGTATSFDTAALTEVANNAVSFTGGNDSITLAAVAGGGAAGTAGNAVTTLAVQTGQAEAGTSVSGNTLTVNVTGATATLQDITDAINAGGDFTADLGSSNGAASLTVAGGSDDDENANFNLTPTSASTINLAAEAGGPADGLAGNTAANIALAFDASASAASTSFDTATNTLTVTLNQADDGTATVGDVINAINAGTDFNATAGTSVAGTLLQADDGTNPGTIGAITNSTPGSAAVTRQESFTFNTVAGADNDFNIRFQTAASADITDATGGTGELFGVSGNATIGFTVTLANDAATNLTNLASELSGTITELDSVAFSGGGGDTFDPSTRDADAVLNGGASVSVTGSAAATTSAETISLSAQGVENVDISFVSGAVVGGATSIAGDLENGLTVTVADGASLTQIAADLGAIDGLTADFSGSGTLATFSQLTTTDLTLTGGGEVGEDVITITANETGEASNRNIVFATDNSLADGAVQVTDADGTITVTVDGNSEVDLDTIVSEINTQLTGFTASLTGTGGSGTFTQGIVATPQIDQPDEGVSASGGILADAVIELSGSLGAEVFNLQAGTTLNDLVSQIQLVSDATGVTAELGEDGTTLELSSTTFGADSVVDLRIIEEGDADESGTPGTFTAAVGSGSRVQGTDIQATVNGVAANGSGNTLSINTATLDLTTSVEAGFTGLIEFDITGGGANFQLGPDVVSNQQARLGIGSVNTAALGGVSGALFQLGSGQLASLSSNPTQAASIVEEAINEVTSLRGRLGAFQRTTLETNRNALNDTLTNLSEAESSIRDADFAAETAELTRSQILVQSSTQVLSIANQNPQNVLALLG